MIEKQEYEIEFYVSQNDIMKKRYSISFKELKINWINFINWVENELEQNEYWIWIFLCGLEGRMKEKDFKKNIKQDSIRRFYNIKGELNKIKEYVRNI